jgi:hypothetical protein
MQGKKRSEVVRLGRGRYEWHKPDSNILII